MFTWFEWLKSWSTGGTQLSSVTWLFLRENGSILGSRKAWLTQTIIIARKGGWMRRNEGYTPLPIHNPYSLLSYWREWRSQAATPLTTQGQNGWKEVAEVELLPSFSKEERESNITTACFMWDETGRKMGKKNTGHLLTQHPEIQQKY